MIGNQEKRWGLWVVVTLLAFVVMGVWNGPLGFLMVCVLVLGGYILEARLNIDKSHDD